MICEKEYHTIQGHECLSSCISNYFYNNGLALTGSDIFFLGDGFHITYQNNDNMVIGADLYNANYTFCDRYHVTIQHEKCLSKESAKNLLKQSILEERKICIKVSSECLKYNKVFKQASGSPHFINVIGIKEQELYISDGYVPTYVPSAFEGWVFAEHIMEAWKRMQYEYVILDDNFDNLSAELLESEVKNKIQFGIYEYLNESMVEGELYIGEKAVLHLLEDLEKVFDENKEVGKLVYNINYQLKIYGFITSKQMLLEKLIFMKYDETNLLEYQIVIDGWNKLCLLLLKAGLSGKKEYFLKMHVKAMILIEKERSILVSIFNSGILGSKKKVALAVTK